MTEEQVSQSFNAAIDFALDGEVDHDGLTFLRMWREGDWGSIRAEFPDFDLSTTGQISLREIEQTDKIKEVTISSFADLLEKINFGGGLLEKDNKYIFRGQSDSSWGLEPGAFRKSNRKYRGMPPLPEQDQIIYELIDLGYFLDGCDRAGLSIPHDSEEHRKKFVDWAGEYDARGIDFPEKEQVQYLAYAQHAEMPTRLLDWSEGPLAAIFFAVSGALNIYHRNLIDKKNPNSSEATYCALYVLDIGISCPLSTKVWNHCSDGSSLHVAKIPSGNNANISSQLGVFTYIRERIHEGKVRKYNAHCNFLSESGHSRYLKRILIPYSIILEVSEGLEHLGVNYSTIYPDLYGAAKSAKLRSLIDDINHNS